ncbi:MAG: DUF421 domain-containing protein [Clostridia bacterium]|nr:DUF421 domain-containing protein [Clostridia bacterium]
MITTIIRTVILYMFLTVGVRLMGKRQIGDMQPNELVITLLISELAAIPLQDTGQPLLFGITAIFMLVVLEISMSVLAMKSKTFRRLTSGKSVVVIKNGEIDQAAMKSVRMTILDLVELLRGQNVFDIDTVAYAVLEVNGDLSVLLKSPEQNATAKDLGLKPEPARFPVTIITDGKLEKDSLKNLKITEIEVEKILQKNKTSIKEVFLMTMDRQKKYNIINKRKNL